MKFTKFFALALGLVSFFSCGPKQTETAGDLPVALQLYTVRDDMGADFLGTLQKVKEMGYDGVEFAGLFGHEPKQVNEWCESVGLVPISAHVPFDEMVNDIDKVIADYKTVGCEYIVVPYVSEECHPDGANFLQMVKDIVAPIIEETTKALNIPTLWFLAISLAKGAPPISLAKRDAGIIEGSI